MNLEYIVIGVVGYVVLMWLIDHIPSKKEPTLEEMLWRKPRK